MGVSGALCGGDWEFERESIVLPDLIFYCPKQEQSIKDIILNCNMFFLFLRFILHKAFMLYSISRFFFLIDEFY